jgi:hypothetical protein
MSPKEMPSWYIEKAGEFSTEDHMSDVECPIIIKCFKKAYELLAPHIIDWQPIDENIPRDGSKIILLAKCFELSTCNDTHQKAVIVEAYFDKKYSKFKRVISDSDGEEGIVKNSILAWSPIPQAPKEFKGD